MKTVLDHVIAFYKSNGLYDKYKIYLEYMSFYHEFLTSVVRINKSDPASSFQSDLRDHFLNSFPEYRNNPYIQRIPLKYKVLRKLIESGNWKVLHAVMHANDRIRGNIF